MRILFMGTPQFAAVSLQRLVEDGHDICGVFTKPDVQKGRGMKLAFSEVKTTALRFGLPVFQPATLKDEQAVKEIAALSPELIVVVAYGKILPKAILDIPKYGCINIHGSLLPKYRGSAPIQWSVINGEPVAGVTAMYMAEKMDAGDMISSRSIPIGKDDTSGDVFEKLAPVGAELLSETVSMIESGTAVRTPQNEDEATYAPMITKDISPIDWNRPGKRIISLINGLIPWPVSTCVLGGTQFKVYKARFDSSKHDKTPGTLIDASDDGIAVACSDGVITITELQASGGKRMAASAYLRGHSICQ